jgi:hypothetical protein
MNRRDLFKFLAGIGLGAVAIETYERLYHIPMLETMFRKELEYWINQYNTAREEVERLIGQLRGREGEISGLRSDLARSKEELEYLMQRYSYAREEVSRLSEKLKQSVEEINSLKEKTSYWETQYNTAREEVGKLNSIINKLDELERESTSAITYYRERMNEAIRNLREIIERYRVLLGDERVSFESSTVKILEDLKLMQEKLQRVLPYFPLILNFYWRPTRVVNDKIYDVNVAFEVISPLSSLEVVEVTLRPIEYKYFITKYGMREEDYNKVFPEEDVRIVRIKPLQIERMVFSVDFKDLKGGREYFIEVRVRDTAGNERIVEIKTPYIRQFENIAKTDDITVATFYYNWYTPGYDIPKDLPDKPLLGLYYSDDNVVFNKHVDWATGHGIDVFVFPWFYAGTEQHRILENNMKADLFSQIKLSFISTFVDRVSPNPPYNFDDPKVKEEFINNINYIKEHYTNLPNFWKINGKPVIVTWSTHAYQSKEGNIKDAFEKVESNKDIYIIGEIASNLAIDKKFYSFLEASVYGIYNYQPVLAPFHPWEMDKWPKRVSLSQILSDILSIMDKWSNFAESLHIKYFPTVSPGFDNTYDYRTNNRPPVVERDSQTFQEFVKNSRKRYLDKEEIKIIFVTSFNEWFEQTQLEPTHVYGFDYLKSLYKGLNEKS